MEKGKGNDRPQRGRERRKRGRRGVRQERRRRKGPRGKRRRKGSHAGRGASGRAEEENAAGVPEGVRTTRQTLRTLCRSFLEVAAPVAFGHHDEEQPGKNLSIMPHGDRVSQTMEEGKPGEEKEPWGYAGRRKKQPEGEGNRKKARSVVRTRLSCGSPCERDGLLISRYGASDKGHFSVF